MARSIQVAAVAATAIAALTACARAEAVDALCVQESFDEIPYVVCRVVAGEHDIRLFHSDGDGAAYLDYAALADALETQGETLVFAMNGGMYHEDRRPVGLFVDRGQALAPLNTNAGPGNFHMLPNGVFTLDGDSASVLETHAYAESWPDDPPDYATQSGPLLVSGGELHPEINPDGTSRKRRNGVGVGADGRSVYFVISEIPVTFHDFATVFRDHLDAPDALYLDGVVSRLYSTDLDRDERGLDMGPMVGVVK